MPIKGTQMRDTPTQSRSLISVNEATLARRVRAASVPVVILFRSSSCAASAALRPELATLAAEYDEQLVVLSVDVERAPFVAEQYGVAAVPTLLVLRDGDELTRLIGFVPRSLLRVFFADVLANELREGLLWHPTEQVFEDGVILPLLDEWGWSYRRQVVCPRPADRSLVRGRVDILVYENADSAPLTLFEAKRHITSAAALQQASLQARRYAEAFHLPSYVVAAPSGMWLYRMDNCRSQPTYAYSSLDVATQSTSVKHTLQQLANESLDFGSATAGRHARR